MYSKLKIILIFFIFSPSVYAEGICSNFLTPFRYDIVKPILNANQNLKLPSGFGRQDTKFKSNITEGILKSLSFFRPSLEKLNGGLELFKIFETSDQITEKELKANLNVWTSKYIPGYEVLFLDDIKRFKFMNSYPSKSIPIYDPETGTLDDKFLFELYAIKKIPILKVTDLVSQILVLSAPQLRDQFEILVNLYQRGQDLGDQTTEDQSYDRTRVIRPHANKNRLQYISTITELLISRLVFLSPYNKSRQLVLFGSFNLLESSEVLNSMDIRKLLDLSLSAFPSALNYFEEQAKNSNRSVFSFFNFLVKANLVSKPAKDHMTQSRSAHFSLSGLMDHFNILSIESKSRSIRANDSSETAWIRFSDLIFYDRLNPIAQISKYGFRFDWIEHYVKIVESDIISSELSAKKQPGPLFQ